MPDIKRVDQFGHWTVSSFKNGYSFKELQNDDTSTYWQSDGTQPHLVNIEFTQRMILTEFRILLDYQNDESYTPNKLLIRLGSSFQDLQDFHIIQVDEPNGWISVSLEENW